jgi:hypothetical protein
MAFFKDPMSGTDMAMVHSCRPYSVKNEEVESAISESWHLQCRPLDGYLEPMYAVVPCFSFKDHLRVYIEDPTISTKWPIHRSSGHVIVVLSCSRFWAEEFLDYNPQEQVDDK